MERRNSMRKFDDLDNDTCGGDVCSSEIEGGTLAEESDIHGLRTILRPDTGTSRRIVWVVFFCLAILLLVLQMGERVKFYVAKHHITKTDVMHPLHLDFPAVTICNMNRHKVSKITAEDIVFIGPLIGLTDDALILKHSQHYHPDWVDKMFVNTDWSAVKESMKHKSFDLEEFTNRTRHRFEDMVVNCVWRGVPCDDRDWNAVFTHHGVCYTFNQHITSSHNISKSGNGNGLRLMLNVEQHEYIESADSSDLGFMIELHHQRQPPLVTEFGFGITSGFHYLIAMKMQEIKSLPYPYGTCRTHEEEHLDSVSYYSLSGCRLECQQAIVYEQCGCRVVESPNKTIPICDHVAYGCAIDVLRKIEATDICVCATPCHLIEYIPLISALRLRDETVDIAKRRHHNMDDTLVTGELAVVNVYYQAMSYDLIEMVPAYSIVALLCDLGGNMGLYVGASLMAIFQIIDRCMINIQHKIHQARKRSEKRRRLSQPIVDASLVTSNGLPPPIITVEYIYTDSSDKGKVVKTLSI